MLATGRESADEKTRKKKKERRNLRKKRRRKLCFNPPASHVVRMNLKRDTNKMFLWCKKKKRKKENEEGFRLVCVRQFLRAVFYAQRWVYKKWASSKSERS